MYKKWILQNFVYDWLLVLFLEQKFKKSAWGILFCKKYFYTIYIRYEDQT